MRYGTGGFLTRRDHRSPGRSVSGLPRGLSPPLHGGGGEIDRDLWYDSAGRLIRFAFPAPSDLTVTFTATERV